MPKARSFFFLKKIGEITIRVIVADWDKTLTPRTPWLDGTHEGFMCDLSHWIRIQPDVNERDSEGIHGGGGRRPHWQRLVREAASVMEWFPA
jgi:hypothetical protein